MTQVTAPAPAGRYTAVLGKKLIDVSTLTADYVSEYGYEFPYFFITAVTAGAIKYTDAFDNEHTETFTDGQVVTGGEPGSAFPVPMLCKRIFMTGSVADCMVAYGP